MKKASKHHVLSPNDQEENDKNAIRNIIESYDIEDAILILYNGFTDVRTSPDHIDACINKIDDEIKESRRLYPDE